MFPDGRKMVFFYVLFSHLLSQTSSGLFLSLYSVGGCGNKDTATINHCNLKVISLIFVHRPQQKLTKACGLNGKQPLNAFSLGNYGNAEHIRNWLGHRCPQKVNPMWLEGLHRSRERNGGASVITRH